MKNVAPTGRRGPDPRIATEPGISRGLVIALILGLGLTGVEAQSQESAPLVPIERFTLDNGMTFLLVDRPGVPNISAGWVARVGSADDPDGQTGLSHMLEHMMFKGTRTIGTEALKKDLRLIEQEDRLWEEIRALESRGLPEDASEIQRLRGELQRTTEAGRSIRRLGELDLRYATAGSTGLNAVTMQDLTAYYVNLPAEKIELWFWLESDRLLEPVFRDFHIEKQVVVEERRMRVESSPTGALEEELLGKLWPEDPYGRPAIGHPEDLATLGRPDARRHFDEHYSANGLTAVLVGPLADQPIRQLAQRYFGRLASGPEPNERIRATSLEAAPEPLVATCDCRPQVRVVYPGVALGHPDGAALEVLVGLLNGRTGRLHRSLVLEQEIAFSAFARRTPLARGGQIGLTAEAKGDTRLQELLAALDGEITRLRNEPVGEREFTKVRNRLRAEVLRRLREPSEVMVQLLVHAGLGKGDHLNTWLARLDAVAPEDIQRVVETYLPESRRAIGMFEREGRETSGAPATPREAAQ